MAQSKLSPNIKEQFQTIILEQFKNEPKHKRHYSDISALKSKINLYDWLFESKNLSDRIEETTNRFLEVLNKCGYNDNVINDKKCAFKALAEYVWRLFDGDYCSELYLKEIGSCGNMPGFQLLAQLVAGTAIWPDKSVISDFQGKNSCILFPKGDYCYVRATRLKKGTIISGRTHQIAGRTYQIKSDDNTQANQWLKKAILKSWKLPTQCFQLFVNFTACHIWDETGNPDYYLNLKNLILVPNVFAGLTDHSDSVKEIIRYHSQLEGPDGTTQPKSKTIKAIYPHLIWRSPHISEYLPHIDAVS